MITVHSGTNEQTLEHVPVALDSRLLLWSDVVHLVRSDDTQVNV